MNQQFFRFWLNLKTFHILCPSPFVCVCVCVCVCVTVPPQHGSKYHSPAAGVTRANASPEYLCLHYPWHRRSPGTSAVIIHSSGSKSCVCVCVCVCVRWREMLTYSLSLSEWVYCTTWQQGGLHDRLYRLCRYSPASSSSSSSSSSSPSSSPWLNSLRLSAAAVQLLYFHPTSSPYTSLLLVRLVSSLSLSLHHCTLSSVVVLRHGATWPLNREIYFHATMINRINDQTYLCTQLLCRWDDKKTDDISVNCCLQQVKPAPNSIRQCHNLRVSTKNHNYGSSCQTS